MGIAWSTRRIIYLAFVAALLQPPHWGRNKAETDPVLSGQPAFCGPQDQKLEVIREPEGIRPTPPASGKARIHIFWRGSRFRIWKGAQCRVALNGAWVAALAKHTYSIIDVEPGKLRMCSSNDLTFGDDMKPTWRSLMFLYASPGDSHFIECSPGGDTMGMTEPALSEVDEATGVKIVSKQQLVKFRVTAGSQ